MPVRRGRDRALLELLGVPGVPKRVSEDIAAAIVTMTCSAGTPEIRYGWNAIAKGVIG